MRGEDTTGEGWRGRYCEEAWRGEGRGQEKAARGGGFVVEGGDGFEEAGDGEGFADAAFAADQAEGAGFAAEEGHVADEGGQARAVDLFDGAEVDDDFQGAAGFEFFEGGVEFIAGGADDEAAGDADDVDAIFFLDGNVHGVALPPRGSIFPFRGGRCILRAVGIIRWRGGKANECAYIDFIPGT